MNMREEVEMVLNTRIRPALQMDGGDIELIEVDEEAGLVKVALRGACAHCPYSTMTSLNVVEKQLKELVPGVKKVETVA
jgi:Fe-S cluster biogenesis protein NfuA